MSIVKADEFGMWRPEPWPDEHHDKEGKVLPFLANGRYANPWMKDRPSPARFFTSRMFNSGDSALPDKTQLDETLPVRTPVWMSDNHVAGEARERWTGSPSSPTPSSLTEPVLCSLLVEPRDTDPWRAR